MPLTSPRSGAGSTPARTSSARQPEELAAVLGWQASYEADYRRYGAIIIDATRPLGEVVEILAVSANDPP